MAILDDQHIDKLVNRIKWKQLFSGEREDMYQLRLFLLLSFFFWPSLGLLTLPKYFTDDMVLQAAPTKSRVWGTTDDSVTNSVTVNVVCDGYSKLNEGTVVRYLKNS